MADICYEVVTDASTYESKPLHSGRRQRFPMDKTLVMQEEREKNCKRNKQEALAVRNEETVNVSGESPMMEVSPRYGVSSVCGRRREMEDAVAVHPSFSSHSEYPQHYFGVYDGHGCSHVAARCRERLHNLVREELNSDREEEESEWRKTMERSFTRMDK